jgi:hypothetical protein
MVGTVEGVLAERKDKKAITEELDDFDKKMIGAAVRLEIPFTSVYNMRKIAEFLHGYADMLDNYSRRSDIKDRAILYHLKMEARRINAKIRKACNYKLRPSECEEDPTGKPLRKN